MAKVYNRPNYSCCAFLFQESVLVLERY